MPATILARTIIVTKLTSSGNFLFQVSDGNGGIKFEMSLLSADMATAAALGSGSSTTLTYAQDAQKADYDRGYAADITT